MTPLRQKMIDAMQVRGLSPRTHRSYLGAVTDLAKYYLRSPDQLSGEELQAFFLYLVKERDLSPAILIDARQLIMWTGNLLNGQLCSSNA